MPLMMVIWDKVFKNGQSGFADNRRWSILLGPFLNTLSHVSLTNLAQLSMHRKLHLNENKHCSSMNWIINPVLFNQECDKDRITDSVNILST